MIAWPWPLGRKQSAGEPPPLKRRFVERHLTGLSLFLLVSALVIAVLYPYMVKTVPTGHVGVLWKRLNGPGIYCWCFLGRGTVLDPKELRDEGLHLIWPWDLLYIYDLRLQTTTQTYHAISKDGVSINATIAIRFQLKHDDAAVLHKFIGQNYVAAVVQKEIGSRAREVMSEYTAEEIYSTKRQQVEDEIRTTAQQRLGEHLDRLLQPQANEQVPPENRTDVTYSLRNAIEIFDTLLLEIKLPPTVVAAINRKIEQYYRAQEYDFRIDIERKESERKRIEAVGIHDFQQVVSQGISDSYLRWRGIEATLELAKSSNAKVVIVGGGKDGLPIILNADGTAAPPPGSGSSGGASGSGGSGAAAGEKPSTGGPSTTPSGSKPSSGSGSSTGAAASGGSGAAAGENSAAGGSSTGTGAAGSGAAGESGGDSGSGKTGSSSGSAKPGANSTSGGKSTSGSGASADDKTGTSGGKSFDWSDLKDLLSRLTGNKGSGSSKTNSSSDGKPAQ